MDFWTDPTHTQPVFAAIMAGQFLISGGEGDVYSEDEIRDMLAATAWVISERRPLTGPASLVVTVRQ